jgi:hypothetical protein
VASQAGEKLLKIDSTSAAGAVSREFHFNNEGFIMVRIVTIN